MTHFDNSVPLKSQWNDLDTPRFLGGICSHKDDRVTVYTWNIIEFLLVLSKKGGSTLVNV